MSPDGEEVAVSVVIPFRAGGGERAAALEWLSGRYGERFPGWELVVAGDDDEGGWSKGVAVARATRRALGRVLVVSDADVWCDDVGDAVGRVAGGEVDWAMPHEPVRRLDAAATGRVLAGVEPDWEMGLERGEYQGVRGGGLVVVTREALAAAPLDPRFRGWGTEDIAWGDALRATVGVPWRGTAVLWHLWHPPESRMSPYVGNLESKELGLRYRRARRRTLEMPVLVAEAHDALSAAGVPLHAHHDRPANSAEGESNGREGR